jgi:chorismate dehydratase
MIKLGCVPYINALPLTFYLDPKKFEILHRPPAELFKLLKAGKVDAALLPIIDYFENDDLFLFPEIAIGSKGPVKSVKLFFAPSVVSPRSRGGKVEGGIEKLKNIYLDSESKTSQLLLKVLLKHQFGISLSELNFINTPDDPRIQAELLIGDKALILGDSHTAFLDLGNLWFKFTQKPFVFATWMTLRKENVELTESLKKSRDEGIKNLSKITQNLSHLPALSVLDYLTHSVRYSMGPEELEGIKTFYEYLKPIKGYDHELDFRFVSQN